MRDEVRALFSNKGRIPKRIISVAVDDEILAALDELTKEFGVARSDACRKILRYQLLGKYDELISPARPWATKTRPRGAKLEERNINIMKSFVEEGYTMSQLMEGYQLSEKQIRKILGEMGVWDKDIAYPKSSQEKHPI